MTTGNININLITIWSGKPIHWFYTGFNGEMAHARVLLTIYITLPTSPPLQPTTRVNLPPGPHPLKIVIIHYSSVSMVFRKIKSYIMYVAMFSVVDYGIYGMKVNVYYILPCAMQERKVFRKGKSYCICSKVQHRWVCYSRRETNILHILQNSM